jgi:hypothetical protein
MDPAASAATVPTADSGPEKQPKLRMMAKDTTPDKRKIESEKRTGQREAAKNPMLAARLVEELPRCATLANIEDLASKAAVRVIMLMKQEALDIVFGGAASMPPPHSIADALSTNSIMSTPSGHPSLEPRMPGVQASLLGTHTRTGGEEG